MARNHLLKLKKGVGTGGFVSPKQAAELMAVSKSAIYSWIDQKKFPAYKLNGSVRIKTEDLLNYVDVNARRL